MLTLTIKSTTEFAKLLSLAAAGSSFRFSGWDQWVTETFRVDSGSKVSIGIDGESVSMDPPLDFAVHRGRLRVAVPPGTTLGAEAGLFSSPTKLSSLWRVAQGRPDA